MKYSSSKFRMCITITYLCVVLLPLPYTIGNRKRKMMKMWHLGKTASKRNNRKKKGGKTWKTNQTEYSHSHSFPSIMHILYLSDFHSDHSAITSLHLTPQSSFQMRKNDLRIAFFIASKVFMGIIFLHDHYLTLLFVLGQTVPPINFPLSRSRRL